MKRRSFLKKAGIATAGIIGAPYLLPSGRLFAATGARLANHVVVCLFAGGVRNFESVQKADGNLMPNMLNGSESISVDIASAMTPLPSSPLMSPLQNSGTLFKDFRYREGPAGHYAGHTVAMTGRYTNSSLNIKAPPEYPTVFELYRKHSSPTANALNAWWVSNALGPYPQLNYSTFDGYGAEWGANFMQPTSLISLAGLNALGNMKEFSAGEKAAASEVRSFLDKNFSGNFNGSGVGINTSDANFETVQNFIKDMLSRGATGEFTNPWGAGGAMNSDMYNIFFAEEIIKEFQPELMVVNMQDVDVCHFNFTSYADNLRKADFAVAHLWDTIQSTPGMANDTVLIVVPEHGRNAEPNTVIDAYGRYAIDHTAIAGDPDHMSRQIFCLVAGPSGVVNQGVEISTKTGESIDVVSTISTILGFDTDIPGFLTPPGRHLSEAFV